MPLMVRQTTNSIYPLGLEENNLQTGNHCITTDLHQEILHGIGKDVVNFDNAAINVENSTDVIIGSVNNFNGPVTIFQNVDNESNSKTKEEQFDSKLVNSGENEKQSKKTHQILHSIYFRYMGIPLLIIVLITIIILGVTQFNKKNSNNEDLPPNSNNNTIGNHQVFDRKIWGGKPSLNFTRPLHHPTPLVIISHSASDFCTTISECSGIVRSAQEYHVANVHSPDIGYNFLIGGDSNIYVGRGWDIRNFHRDNTIGISFIGNFVYDQLTPNMIDAALELLKYGVEKGKISEDYKVICHNQTMVTLSPGVNVYKVVKKWPNFRSGNLI